MQNETTVQPQTEFVVHFDNKTAWLVALGNDYTAYRHTGWQFVDTLRYGIDQFGARSDKTELYEAASNHTGLSVKTLQNYVSMARKPASAIAATHGLEIGHAVAVLGLDDDHAASVLMDAAEQQLPVEAIRAIVREYKQPTQTNDLPAVGNERHAALTAPNHATDDEPPFAQRNNVLYDDYGSEANALAGSSAAYDYGDDEDGYTYTGAEFMSLMQRATNRLRDTEMWQEQRTVNEWLAMVARHTY